MFEAFMAEKNSHDEKIWILNISGDYSQWLNDRHYLSILTWAMSIHETVPIVSEKLILSHLIYLCLIEALNNLTK